MKKKTKKLAKKLGATAGIVGGVAAVGYAAAKLIRKHGEQDEESAADETSGTESVEQLETPEQMNMRDAQRAQDFEPGGNFEAATPRRDVVGDPSVRTSVGLETNPTQPGSSEAVN